VILYEMLTGAAPFTGESVNAVMYQIVNFVPPAPSAINPASPPALDQIVARMLAKALDERAQSAAEIARGLRECERQALGASSATGAGSATSATSTLPLPGLAPGPTPAVVDREVKSAVLSQTVERSRRAESTDPEAPAARGVSRTFDSLEATQRLVALSDAARQSDPSAGTLPFPLQATQTAGGTWKPRDTLIVLAGAVAGLIVAALIVLA
jgi:serine/threonine-protein kinase